MKLAQYVLPLLLAARAVPAAGLPLTDFLPPDTKTVFGFRVHDIAASPLAPILTAPALASGAVWLKMVWASGFDPLRDIDEVLISTSGAGPNPAAIILVKGRFDIARLTEGVRRYHDVPLLGGEKDTDSVVALLDESTAITGDPALVRAAIDRRDGGARIDPAFRERIASLRERYDIWGLGELADGFTAPAPEAKALESIDRFQFGIQLATGLELGAEIHARSAADAGKLHTALEMVASLLQSQRTSESARKFELQVEDSTIKVTLAMSQEEFQKAILAETAALSSTTDPPPPPAASAATPVLASTKPPSQVLDKEGNTVILRLPGKK